MAAEEEMKNEGAGKKNFKVGKEKEENVIKKAG